MAQRISDEELDAAWRALSGVHDEDGWQTIPIAAGSPCTVMAGRRFPGNEEALLVGFHNVSPERAGTLPEAKGFMVTTPTLAGQASHTGLHWFALVRQPIGRLDLFTAMVVDIISVFHSHRVSSQDELVHVFLRRVRAWQAFMERSRDGGLGPEAEIGLLGELIVLRHLLSLGVLADDVLESWLGPMEGLHDFRLGVGVIEVKATISKGQFLATIGSLDQLDDGLNQPLILAAIRLALTAGGFSLPEYIEGTRDLLQGEPRARVIFEERLLHASVRPEHSDLYTRRFVVTQERFLTVAGDFPRLTRGTIPQQIRDARYQLDLDLVASHDVTLSHAIGILKVS